MAGPWEKYQTSAAAPVAAGKPWEKYAPVQASAPQAPAEAPLPSADTESQVTEAANAGLQGYGQGATLGYLPQLQAGFGYAVEKANEALGGDQATPYADLREHFKRRNERLKEESPIATGVGNVAGVLGGSLIGGTETSAALKGLGITGKAAQAAAAGGAYGALSNPEVESTDEDPYANLKARLKNAGIGTAFGFGGEKVIGGTARALEKAGEKLSQKAVVKQIGANAGQIKKILQKGNVDEIGGFLSENGMMKPGTALDDVAEKSSQILAEDGPKIANLYDEAQRYANAGRQSGIPIAKIDGNKLADEIVQSAKNASKNHPDRNLVNKTIEDAVGPLRDMGPEANIKDLHDFRKGLDENINWGQRGQERDAVQRALVNARNLVQGKANAAIDQLDGKIGSSLLDSLKKLNARYSTASTVSNIATQGAARETAKAFMGHGVIGAGAGAGAASLEYRRSHDPLKALGVGLATATAVTAARKYGSPVGYYGGRAANAVGRGVQAITPAPGRLGPAVASPWLMMNQGEK